MDIESLKARESELEAKLFAAEPALDHLAYLAFHMGDEAAEAELIEARRTAEDLARQFAETRHAIQRAYLFQRPACAA